VEAFIAVSLIESTVDVWLYIHDNFYAILDKIHFFFLTFVYFYCIGVQIDRAIEEDGTHCCLVAIGRLQVTSTPNTTDLAGSNSNAGKKHKFVLNVLKILLKILYKCFQNSYLDILWMANLHLLINV